jgi:hypothetical protein
MDRQRKRRKGLWLCVALGAALCYAAWLGYAGADTFTVHTVLTYVSITNPTANEVWLAGSDHDVSCTTSTDEDCNTDTGQVVQDSVSHWWITYDGSFKNGTYIGTSGVTYICRDTSGTDTIFVYADDDYAPDNNTYLADDTPECDTKSVSVVIPQLEWVQFGGTSKHTLYKKDAAQWNVENEDYATNYATAVPNKAWVRDPLLKDPVCYTKNAGGAQVTASINFTTPDAVTEASTVNLKATDGSQEDIFTRTGVSVSVADTTVPAMNMATALMDYVQYLQWELVWRYKVPSGSNTWIELGTSNNYLFVTWGTPNGSTVTAKRMLWATYVCTYSDSVAYLGYSMAHAVHDYTIFGGDNPTNRWQALDYILSNDCLASSALAVTALQLLGIPTSACDSQVSYPSTVPTSDPDYPADVTIIEYDGEPGEDTQLMFSMDGGDSNWNFFEGSFKIQDGSTWYYWAVFSVNLDERGPFVGTGTTDSEKDKSARYQVLDDIHDSYGYLYVQAYAGEREADDLPQP